MTGQRPTGLTPHLFVRDTDAAVAFYRTAFGNVSAGQQDFGLGSALAVLIFLFIALVAGVITTRLRAREIQI